MVWLQFSGRGAWQITRNKKFIKSIKEQVQLERKVPKPKTQRAIDDAFTERNITKFKSKEDLFASWDEDAQQMEFLKK